MNISLTNLWTTPYNLIRQKMATGLTPMQKNIAMKVALFAIAYFACALGFLFYYSFSSKKDEMKEKKIVPNDLAVKKISSNNSSPLQLQNKETLAEEIDASNLKDETESFIIADDEDQSALPVKEGKVPKEGKNTLVKKTSVLSVNKDPSARVEKKSGLPFKENKSARHINSGKDDLSRQERRIEKFESFSEKPKKTLQERLHRNREAAIKEQKNQKPRNFNLYEGEVPATLETRKKSFPIIEESFNPFTSSDFTQEVGLSLCQGKARKSMEDEALAVSGSFFDSNRAKFYGFELYGVFDGHVSNRASKWVKANLEAYLTKSLTACNAKGVSDEGVFKALKDCFIKLHDDYPSKGDGTTAIIALLIEGKIWIANVGDSRAVLVKNGKAIQASEDAKPNNPRFKRAIEKLGGYVESDRVMGSLAVARAIGDKSIKSDDGKTCCVSPKPKITNYPIGSYDTIIIACDGVWDVVSTDEVGVEVEKMRANDETATMMANRLVYSALVNGSGDNVSVVVVKLNS